MRVWAVPDGTRKGRKTVELREQIEEAVAAVRAARDFTPRVGIILGTGLGTLSEQIEDATAIPYGTLPHFPTSTVETHAGELVLDRKSVV